MHYNNLIFRILGSILLSVTYTLSFGQLGSISGTVTDENKEEVIGATVFLEGTSIGTYSNEEGVYKLEKLAAGTYTVIFRYIGYETKKEVVELGDNDQKTLDIQLGADALLLDEVIMIGYGTQQRRDISSSVSTIGAEEIEGKPVFNFASSMQGQAAGVQVTTDNGLAGSPVTVRVRGTNSISGSVEPLYVVDGIPIFNSDLSDASGRLGYSQSPLSMINPNDIESITVLKDAAATAIYGARGANGVVIVTTKSGKAGKAKVDISYDAGVSTASNKLPMLDGDQYVELYLEAWHNDSLDGNNTGSAPTAIKGIDIDSISNTDWIREVLQMGQFHNLNLSVSGGTEKTTYFMGGSFRDETTFLKGNKFQRLTFRANLDHNFNKFFSMGYNVSFARTLNHYVRAGAAGGLGRAQAEALPIFPIFNDDSTYFGAMIGLNPVADLVLPDFKNISYRTLGNVHFEIKPVKGLTWRNELGLDWINQHETFFTPASIMLQDQPIAEDRRINYYNWNINSTLTYKTTIKEKHNLAIMAGFNPQQTVEEFTYISGTDFPSSQFTQVQGAGTISFATAGTGQEYTFASFFGRINYEFSRKYMAQVSFRADGSSRFGPENKFGYFPAGSIGWIISEENFLKENPILSYLKLRASLGTTGNAEIGNFSQQNFFGVGQNYAGQPGIGPVNLADTTIKWETNLNTTVGIDFGILNDRISGSLEYFYNRSSEVLVVNVPIAPSSGYGSIDAQNLAVVQNQGIDIQLSSNNLGPAAPIKWRTDLTLSTYSNKIIDLKGLTEVEGSNFGENRAIEGQPVGAFYMAEYAGIDPETGLEMIYDLEGNTVVANSTNTVSERQVVGTPYPLFFGGLKNSWEWKGLGLDLFFTFSYGNKIYDDHGKRQMGNMGFGWNQDIRTLDRWQNSGDQTEVPKLSLVRNQDINTSRHLYDASFLRLRNIVLYYNFPASITNKLKLRSGRVFLSVQNAFVVTPYKGWDPEVNRENSGAVTQGVTYLSPPQARVFQVGISVGL